MSSQGLNTTAVAPRSTVGRDASPVILVELAACPTSSSAKIADSGPVPLPMSNPYPQARCSSASWKPIATGSPSRRQRRGAPDHIDCCAVLLPVPLRRLARLRTGTDRALRRVRRARQAQQPRAARRPARDLDFDRAFPAPALWADDGYASRVPARQRARPRWRARAPAQPLHRESSRWEPHPGTSATATILRPWCPWRRASSGARKSSRPPR